MWPFKKEKRIPLSESIILSTVHLSTVEEFKEFCDYGFSNNMYIDYAMSWREQWKTVEPIPDCYAIIRYVSKAGSGHLIRVTFEQWNPYTVQKLSDIFVKSPYNYDNMCNFNEKFATCLINWLLHKLYR